jgi:hypothetical protein
MAKYERSGSRRPVVPMVEGRTKVFADQRYAK